MSIYPLTGLINGIIAIFLSLLVYSRNRNQLNRTFTFFILTVAFWSFGYWRWLSVENSLTALLWIKIFTVGSILIPPTFFHWVTSLVDKEKKYRYLTYIFYTISILLLLPLFKTGLVIQSLQPRLFFDYWPIPGPLYAFCILIYAIIMLFALKLLYDHGYKNKSADSARYRLVFWGTIIGFSGGATNFLLWYGIPIPPYGNFLVSVGSLTWGYAAAKYNLFNSKVIATEFFAFVLWIIFLIKLILSDSWGDWLLNATILLATIMLGVLLIKSVNQEIRTRERIEKLAKDLERANERLRELDKQKSEFLSFATHQLRSPLTAIKGYSSLMLEGDFGVLPEAIKEPVDRIYQSTQGMVLMVDDFLNISRIEQGRMKYEMAKTDIAKLAEEIAGELKPVAEKKGLSLSFKTDEGDLNAPVDPGKLRQVIANLIDNSIKYTPSGSVNVSVSKSDNNIRIAISDTGVGISKAEIGNLFEKFSRAKNANKINVTGTGLGLYLAKKIVEAHSGKIWAESAGEGKGSSFIVEIPLK